MYFYEICITSWKHQRSTTSKIYDNNIEKLEPRMIDTIVEN